MFISLQAYSQETEKVKTSISVHVMPLTLIDYTPRIRVGVEMKHGNNISYSLDVGYGNYFLNKNRLIFDGMWWNEDYNFFEVRPELKYYFNDPEENFNTYCALELFYLHMTDHMTNSYYHKDNTENIILFDQADFLKDKLGLHLKAGCNIIAFNRLGVDIYLGLGVAWRQIQYQNVSNPTHGVHGWYEWYRPVYKFEGESIIFHTTMGCKIGLILNKS
jgi:hypothetical protein